MDKRWFFLLVIALVATGIFYLTNERLRGYLRSEVSLAKEVKTPRDSIDQYRIASQAPFKYRLLFPSIIKGSYIVAYDEPDVMGFYHTYKSWSLVFYIASALALFWLLLNCTFEPKLALAGALVFLLLPPMIMAFTLPVHTREDTLAYTLFFAGLVFLIRNKPLPFLIIALLGALTRETLLLLPLLYFFFSFDEKLWRRFVVAGLPGILWLSVRLSMGHEQYDVWEGLKWNLNNPEQVVGFLFITFNFCWLPFLFHLFFFRSNVNSAPAPVRFFYRSAPFALIIILVTTFVGGIYNEIRLLYLFSPWMIIIFIDFMRRYRREIGETIMKPLYWAFAGASMLGCGVLLYFFLLNREKIIVPGKYNVPYDQWIVFSVVYIFIVLLFLPPSFKVFALKRSLK